jgi:hypothetical protein
MIPEACANVGLPAFGEWLAAMSQFVLVARYELSSPLSIHHLLFTHRNTCKPSDL